MNSAEAQSVFEQYRDVLVTLQLSATIYGKNRELRRCWRKVQHRIKAAGVVAKFNNIMSQNNPLEALQREVNLCAAAIEQTTKPR